MQSIPPTNERDTQPAPDVPSGPPDVNVIEDVAADLEDLQRAVRGVDASLTDVITLLRRQVAEARRHTP